MTVPLSQAGAHARREFHELSTRLGRAPGPAVRAAAKRGVEIHERALRAVAGGDMRLSGAGSRNTRKRGGAKVGARVVQGESRAGTAYTVIAASGPVHLVERPTSGHIVTPLGVKGKSASGKRVARKGQGALLAGTFTYKGDRRQVLNIPGIGYRKWSRHGGTRGQKPWERGRERAEPVMREELLRVLDVGIRPR